MKTAMKMILIVVGVILFSVDAYAIPMSIWGQVTSNGVPVSGAMVILRDKNMGYLRTAYTNSGGWYVINYNPYCGWKIMYASAVGYKTVSKKVGDHSCCDCPGNEQEERCKLCFPTLYECGCNQWIRVNFNLTPGSSDYDQDGVIDGEDNCPDVPNGSSAGTCTSGSKKGKRCYRQTECGCGAKLFPCMMWQTDTDGDGIGDACDNDVMGPKAQEASANAHLFMTGGEFANTLALSPTDLFALWMVFLCTHIETSFEGLGDFLITMLRLPSFMWVCGSPVIDQNNNNIPDGEEGMFPENWKYYDYLEAFTDAVAKCFPASFAQSQ